MLVAVGLSPISKPPPLIFVDIEDLFNWSFYHSRKPLLQEVDKPHNVLIVHESTTFKFTESLLQTIAVNVMK